MKILMNLVTGILILCVAMFIFVAGIQVGMWKVRQEYQPVPASISINK